MRIILAHKFYRMTGGTEKYFQDLTAMLTKHGHEPIPFALKHPDNPNTPYEKYFLPDLNYRESSLTYRIQNASRMIGRTLYSVESRQHIKKLIKEQNPDIAHIQSIEHHISPSILHVFRKFNLPVVQSVNTYKLVCASYRLYLLDQEEICEQCLYGKHYHALQTKCVKGSLPASFLAMIEMYLHGIMKIYHLVDRFIVSNDFMTQKLVGAGYEKHKIVKLLNPLNLEEYQPSYESDDYILYFGRLDPEKGVSTLINAMNHLPSLNLVIVGDGSQMRQLQQQVQNLNLQNVKFTGAKWGNALNRYLARARLVIVPSLWYEPSPYVIYQSLACGKPVIGSHIGGIPDLITEETGKTFEPGNVEDLVIKLQDLAFDKAYLKEMGIAARCWAEENFNPEIYYQKLIQIYSELISERS